MKTLEWTLGNCEFAISGIMDRCGFMYVGGLYWERICRYRRDTTRCGIILCIYYTVPPT